ncbi:amidohydrolase [Eubacteriales bacterium OttesenSCG-928-A19]|nr:amidohydrolase [Eubacteriales bacterium OttesenSCG-928-A19]
MREKRILFIALVLAMALMQGALAQATEPQADLYFENGAVYTVDAQDTVAEALAVKDGLIVFVGSAEDGQAYREGAAEVVDLDGGMLLPGLIDGHIHSVTPDFFDFNLLGIMDVDTMLDTVEAYIAANPDKEAYAGYGYMTSVFEGEELLKGPRKERLDAICPDKPLLIYAFDGHAAWANSKCFEASGITRDTPSTPGGQIVKDDETGELWGTLKDTAMSLLPEVKVNPEKLDSELQGFTASLNALGYTSIMTLPGNGFMPLPWEAYARLEDAGLLTMRVRGAGMLTSWKTEEDIADLLEKKAQYNSELVRLTNAKLFADGVMDSESAHLLEAYADNPENHGATVWEQDAINEAVAALNTDGVQAHVHAIGDAAVRMALDAFEYAREHAPEGDYRNVITHLQLVAPEDFERFAELDAVAVAQPYWHYKEPGYWEPIEYAALGERAKTEYPMKSFLDHGVVLAFSSDYPVTAVPNPFVAIERGVTRNLVDGTASDVPDITDMDDPTYLLGPEERLTVREMIRGFTIDAAYSMFTDTVTGSLETGKSADMIVIDQDLLTVDPLAISDTRVLRTYFMGQEVFKAE